MQLISLEGIEKKSIGYNLLKVYARLLFKHFFYRKMFVKGIEKIPLGEPILFAPNHQNALIDPLTILFSIPGHIVFLARADLYKKKTIAKITKFLKILPVFRIRDGKEALKYNDLIFNRSVDIITKKTPMATFPEATHNDKRQLRVLKKGVPRIALQSEINCDFNLGLKIVPVGINYTHYQKSGSQIFLYFDDPILVKDYQELYKESEAKALNHLRIDITERIKPLMIDIQNKEYYNEIYALTHIYDKQMAENLSLENLKFPQKFEADKKTIETIDKNMTKNPEKTTDFLEKIKKYLQLIKKNQLKDFIVEKNQSFFVIFLKSIFFILLLPLFLYGKINNLLPEFIAKLPTRKIKDTQFISSAKYVMGLIFFPLFYLIQTLVMVFVFDPDWYAIIYLATLPPAYIFKRWFLNKSKILIAQWRLLFLKQSKKNTYNKIQTIRKEIIEEMNTMWKSAN